MSDRLAKAIDRCNEPGCRRVPHYVGYCPYHLEQYEQIVVATVEDADEEDVFREELHDVAHGMVTTAFVFDTDDRGLTGFRVPTDSIEWCDFTKPEPPRDSA